jgi:hypothetical protein
MTKSDCDRSCDRGVNNCGFKVAFKIEEIFQLSNLHQLSTVNRFEILDFRLKIEDCQAVNSSFFLLTDDN